MLLWDDRLYAVVHAKLDGTGHFMGASRQQCCSVWGLQAWMQAIRDAWVAALLNPDRYMRRSMAILDTDERHNACSTCASDRCASDFEV